MRINEDGSIRLITQNFELESYYNDDDNDNASVGYMYGMMGLTNELTSPMCVLYDQSTNKAVDRTSTYNNKTTCENNNGKWVTSAYEATHANIVDSTIKKAMDNWYINSTNLSNYTHSHLADAGFCNDRSISSEYLGYGQNTTYYSGTNRTSSPQFSCPNETRDLFTTKTSLKGNKALTYPIGLLTMDEIIYAGAAYEYGNNSMYINQTVTMTPVDLSGSEARVYGYLYGGLYSYIMDGAYPISPVINLKSNIEIIGGNGTTTNPYIIK